ncbi:hypothetical protein [Micromonospora haikouensis]|uniref:hypothetical protein n=1 Tax=Micromonospora haikouensis TaxID=686309 RepID=UPI003D70E5DD
MTAAGLRTAADVVIVLLGGLYLVSFLVIGVVLVWAFRRPEPGASRLAVDDHRQRATATAILQPDSPLLDAAQASQLDAHELPDVAAEAAQYLRQHPPPPRGVLMIDLTPAVPGLAVIAGGVALVLVCGRDADANQHDLSDYHPDAVDAPGLHESRRTWPLVDRQTMPQRPAGAHRTAETCDGPTWTPPVADLVVALVASRYGASAQDIAARWLAELGEQARARLAVTR